MVCLRFAETTLHVANVRVNTFFSLDVMTKCGQTVCMEKSDYIHIRVHPELKAGAKAAAESKGSTLSKEITAFLKRLERRTAKGKTE